MSERQFAATLVVPAIAGHGALYRARGEEGENRPLPREQGCSRSRNGASPGRARRNRPGFSRIWVCGLRRLGCRVGKITLSVYGGDEVTRHE
jgi:hypothetical protein